jgi:flagellar basal-body rod protein FlgG
MFRALYTAASGMNAQQLNLDNVANNLANTRTAGFRRRRVQFTDLLYQNMVMPGSASTQQTTNAAGLQVGLGTKPGASEVLQLQGDFSQTGNPLDLAITLPPDALSVTIGSDGTVSVTQPGQTQATQVGNIQLALFPNPGGLNSVGNNLMLATTASGDPIVGTPGGTEGLGSLQQGFLEQSNVDVVQEFVEMILSQRSYESNSRVVKAADEMFQDLNSLTR